MTKRYNRPLTPKELEAMPDEDIDYSDIPKATPEFWASAEWIEPKDRKSDRSVHPSKGKAHG